MQLIRTFPMLYKTDSRGVQQWVATIYSDGRVAVCSITFGFVNGRHQTVERQYDIGKNIGKKNATTPLAQCLRETEKRWNDKQRKENYSITRDPGASSTTTVYPMLAQKFDPQRAVFPCVGQPKLDGVRCIVYARDEEIVFQSRTGTHFLTMGHLHEPVGKILRDDPSLILDGELYTSSMPFEEFVGLIKKQSLLPEDIHRVRQIRFHVFDVIHEEEPFEQRWAWMRHHLAADMMVPTFWIHNMTEFRTRFHECIEQGYEGIMIRTPGGSYRRNHRSKDLLKYKEFVEDEFVISGFKEGEGRDKGSVVWICRTPAGKEFAVRPKGSLEHRRDLFRDANHHVGKYLTVIYQELTEHGIPRFPVGKAVRFDLFRPSIETPCPSRSSSTA